jgi:hypothetical protein
MNGGVCGLAPDPAGDLSAAGLLLTSGLLGTNGAIADKTAAPKRGPSLRKWEPVPTTVSLGKFYR